MCVWCGHLWKPKDSIGFSGALVAGNCELPSLDSVELNMKAWTSYCTNLELRRRWIEIKDICNTLSLLAGVMLTERNSTARSKGTVLKQGRIQAKRTDLCPLSGSLICWKPVEVRGQGNQGVLLRSPSSVDQDGELGGGDKWKWHQSSWARGSPSLSMIAGDSGWPRNSLYSAVWERYSSVDLEVV